MENYPVHAVASPLTLQANALGMANTVLTVTEDGQPNANTRRFLLTALASAPAGLRVHSPDHPVYYEFSRPAVFKQRAGLNARGNLVEQRFNVVRFRHVGSALVAEGLYQPVTVDTRISVPAGAMEFDELNCTLPMYWHSTIGNGSTIGIGCVFATGRNK